MNPDWLHPFVLFLFLIFFFCFSFLFCFWVGGVGRVRVLWERKDRHLTQSYCTSKYTLSLLVHNFKKFGSRFSQKRTCLWFVYQIKAIISCLWMWFYTVAIKPESLLLCVKYRITLIFPHSLYSFIVWSLNTSNWAG